MKTLGNSTTKERPVRAFSAGASGYPELWLRVHVVGPEYANFPRMFAQAKCWKAKSLYESDFILFTGGASDVHPDLYNRSRHSSVWVDEDLDLEWIGVFREAVGLGIPMVGVCRGAQFLHVMNGGKLYQDVDNHQEPHDIWVKSEQRMIQASSVHHQMCEWQESMEVLADCEVATVKWKDAQMCFRPPMTVKHVKDADIEAFYYRDTACLGVQGHPEYVGFTDYTKWFLKTIEETISCSPDFSYRGNPGCQRLNQEIIDRRSYQEPDYVTKFVKDLS